MLLSASQSIHTCRSCQQRSTSMPNPSIIARGGSRLDPHHVRVMQHCKRVSRDLQGLKPGLESAHTFEVIALRCQPGSGGALLSQVLAAADEAGLLAAGGPAGEAAATLGRVRLLLH